MKSKFLVILMGFLGPLAFSQQRATTLEKCLAAVEQHYPETNKLELLNQVNTLNKEKLNTDYLPQFDVAGQASYQSAVTQLNIDIPNAPTIEPLSKDQYFINLNLDQKIYDGGITSVQKDLQELTTQIDQKDVAITIETIKEQVVNYYFNVLLAERNILILKNSEELLQASLKQTQSRFDNGVAMQSEVNTLKVQALQLDQQKIELEEGKKLSIRLIAILSGLDIDELTELQPPAPINTYPEAFSGRPEFEQLDLRSKQLDEQYRLTAKAIIPKVSLFGQYGYGRPGFNFLKNEFVDYYKGGARLAWDLSAFYTNSKDRQLAEVNKSIITEDKAVLNNRFENRYAQNLSTIQKSERLLERDDAIIQLREGVTKASSSELDNGISTATDYLTEFNNEIDARQNQALHRIQLEEAQYNIKLLTGN